MKYTKQNLIERLDKGENVEFLFFWGHQPSKDGSLSKTCFSQWWPSVFVENGLTFKTAEHYMMAGKAITFKDDEILEKIIQMESPKDVKALGRKVKDFDPDTWNNNKYKIVKQGNLLKFSQNEELKAFLVGTGNKVIVEASPMDRIWGIGMAESNPLAKHPATWKGQNLLGFALMEVRDELMK